MTGWIGISLGDPAGIGPEVTLKALAAELPADDTRYLILGDETLLRGLNARFGLNLPLETEGGPDSGATYRSSRCRCPGPAAWLHRPRLPRRG